MERKYAVSITCVVILLICFVGTTSAMTWYVDDDGGVDFIRIQDAINAASASDTIIVYPGVYCESVVVNKSVRLKGIDHPIVNASYGSAIKLTAHRITLEGFKATNASPAWSDGITVISDYNNIINNTVSNNRRTGIDLYHSSNNIITSNTVSNNGYNGIELSRSNNNSITNNTVSFNKGWNGIDLLFSNNNTISGNNVRNNSYGIYLSGSSNNNTITGNNVSNNNRDGIDLWGSSNNIITGNNVCSNDVGIDLWDSSNNIIYNNNYYNNTLNARDNKNNIWNLTKTAGTNIVGGSYLCGNYWDDYVGIDTNNDCLGDTLLPYNSIGGIQNSGDWAPLVHVGVVRPDIISYAPLYPVIDLKGGERTFSITVNQIVDISWQINGREVQTNVSVTGASYTNTSATIGIWNASAIVSNVHGTTMQTWIWNVKSKLPVHNLNTEKNFSSIQAAIDDLNTKDGHTIAVDPGTYTANINVNKSLTIRSTSGNPENTIVHAANSNDHVFEVSADYVNISGFAVEGAVFNGSVFLRTRPEYLPFGEYLPAHTSGIYLNNTAKCTISNNKVSNNEYGISLGFSNNNSISNNSCLNNDAGILFYGLIIRDGLVTEQSCNDNIISNNICSYNDNGIFLYYSSHNHITNNTCSYNDDGIYLSTSHSNLIRKNIFRNNKDYGVELSWSSRNSICLNNFIENVHNAYIGPWLNRVVGCYKTYTYNGRTYSNYLGNYWDDYRGTDADGDGIGETHHRIDLCWIDEGVHDCVPLMEPFENYITPAPTPCFELLLAIIGVLAAIYWVRRRK